MNTMTRRFAAALTAIALLFGASACSTGDSDYDAREKAQADKKLKTDTLEIKNLQEKVQRDEASAGKTGYVYIMSFGKFVGYYTIKGKISSNGSQLTPEQDIVKPCSGCDRLAVDGPQDDNTYGDGDPGIFFFTTEGAMIVTDLDYLYADQPIAASIAVPKLNPAS